MKRFLYFHSTISNLILFCLVALFAVQCRREDAATESITTSPLSVSVEYATTIAKAYRNDPQNKSARQSAEGQDSLIIDSQETYTNSGQAIFHIINYKNNQGWVLVGADRRVTPILAYSNSGRFTLSQLEDGLKAWVEGVAKLVTKALGKLSKPESMIEARWKYIEKKGGISKAVPGGRVADGNCTPYDQYMHQCPANTMYTNLGYPSTIVGDWGHPWTQTGGYAYYMPSNPPLGSDCALCNNKVVTGCGPVATSMVLVANNRNKSAYKPSGYNFDQMSNYITSSCTSMSSYDTELARLIRFSYDQGGTTGTSCAQATLPDHIPYVFSGAGYSNSGSLVDFSTNQTYLQNDLHLGYPVVISGRTCSTCYETWHIWVIDGFHLDTFYNLDCSGYSPVCQESAFLFYSMKWGHRNNGSADGWYGVGGFSENGDLYDTALKININARP